MVIMRSKFSPSINIIRDYNNEIDYILTTNSQRIFSQIVHDYQIGTRSFNIIGSYGTGKSAFLLAFEQHLKGKKNYFDKINNNFNKIKYFKFLNMIGEYSSIIDSFANNLNLNTKNLSSQTIIKKLDTYYKKLANKNICLVILIDEFGKFLEYASANDPEKELYFVQQIAEYVNDPQKNILFITVLHQSFDEYSRKLNKAQRNEWEKVKGRLKEIVFNEPVEQLLFLASERIYQKNIKHPKNIKLTYLLDTIKKSNVFPLRTTISVDLAKKLYPFDILSASILTLALQTYGQNERSLFTFLESENSNGLSHFNSKKAPYYNLCNIYDYLIHNFSSLLSSKYNPHFLQWRAIQSSVERVDSILGKNHYEATQIVKIIGLLNIFISAGAKIDKEFITNYTKYSLNINNAGVVLKELENKKIVRYLNYKKRYILFEGTDLNIEAEIQQAEKNITPIIDIISPLKRYFTFPYVSAKAASYEFGTPRFFYFEFSDTPTNSKPKGQIDGIINLIFTKKIIIEDIIEYSKNNDEAILFGFYINTNKIMGILNEINKIQYVIDKLVDDRVAERELRNLLEFQKQELNQYVLKTLYINNDDIVWIFKGKKISIKSRTQFNSVLSDICKQVYFKTPVLKNELINREKLPSAISKALNNMLNALINHLDQEDIGFSKDEFPPEKTIYLTLLKRTGIHVKESESFKLAEPSEKSFQFLWSESERFLKSAKTNRKNVNEFIQILASKPFKLKRGFIDFWIIIYLYLKREDFALFGEDGFIPNLNLETLELIIKAPNKFQIKTFELHGVKLDLFNKYRRLLNQKSNQRLSTSSFIETIKPFLSFYNNLNEYSKRTNRLSKSAIRLREAIANATDPEKTFFEDFPKALGYTNLNLRKLENELSDYIIQLQNNIREIRGSFEELINRIESQLLKITGYEDLNFPTYQNEIRIRYKALKTNLLLPFQASYYRQLNSKIDDRNAWLIAIAQSLLGKPIDKMNDEEEEILFEKMNNSILELDNLCDISKIDINPENEDIYKLDITSFNIGKRSQIFRISKRKKEIVSDLARKIKIGLSNDESTNIAALIKLLQEEVTHE